MVVPDDYRKLPFATYDIVVYFGAGLVSLPIAYSLIVFPWAEYLPPVILPLEDGFARDAFLTLAILVSGYLLGHIVAFLSSYFVEKFVHRTYGFPSDLFLDQCAQDSLVVTPKVSVRSLCRSVPMTVMALFHLPLLPFYLATNRFTKLWYYEPKLPLNFKATIEERLGQICPGITVEKSSRWAKIIEHYVANNCPMGYARLYNYLVIFGLMRSLAFVLIGLTWWYLLGAFFDAPDTSGFLGFFGFHAPKNLFVFLMGYVVLGLAAALTMMSFAKFYRRFFEEGILAFVLQLAPNPKELRKELPRNYSDSLLNP